jgi:uncharacterized protein YaeQ
MMITSRHDAAAIIYSFDVDLADVDRQVYESLALRLARRPNGSRRFSFFRLCCLTPRSRCNLDATI